MNFFVTVSGGVFVVSLFLGGPPKFMPPWTAAFIFSIAMLLRLWREERAKGKKVFETENKMNIGKHQLVWNAADAPSGLYIWKLKTGNNFTDGKISVQH